MFIEFKYKKISNVKSKSEQGIFLERNYELRKQLETTKNYLLSRWNKSFEQYIHTLQSNEKAKVLAFIYALQKEPDYHGSELGLIIVDYILEWAETKRNQRQIKDMQIYNQELGKVVDKILTNLPAIASGVH